ncbi:MAG TPA: DUF2911 domain-containing protein [Edaphocola sp.]|nr:DUF2911 domain-containing protein [Edaphocola sp.]
MKKATTLFSAALLISSLSFGQGFKMPALSPSTQITQEFSTSKIELSYSRPSMRGRAIFGKMIPFGQEWRTGANANTKITFGEEVVIGGKTIPAGSYSIYTVPGKKTWEFILNNGTENWGMTGYDKAKNVITLAVKPQKSSKVETFTISIDNMTKNSCDLVLSWEKTKLVIPIIANNDKLIQAYLDKALQSDKPPYLAASRYYLEKGIKLDKSLEYANKALEQDPKAFYINAHKAEVLYKLDRKDEAIKAAQIAADATKGTPYEAEYANILNSLKKRK